MNKLVSVLSALFLCQSIGYAQTPSTPTKFEGEIKAIRTNNLDKNAEKISGGFGYNGATKFSYFVKGEKVLAVDSTLHYSTLYDPQAGTVTFFGHYFKEGAILKWADYEMVLKSWSNAERKYKDIILDPYNVYTVTPIKEGEGILGYPTKLYNVNFEFHNSLSNSRNDIDIETIPSFILPTAAAAAIANCIDVDGIPARIKAVMEQRDFGKTIKTYLGFEIKEIIPDSNIPDSIFNIPSDLKIKKKKSSNGAIFKLNSFIKDNVKYLKKKGLYPKDDEVIFELKDEDWLY